MVNYLIDTNVVCDYVTGTLPEKSRMCVSLIVEAGAYVSVITKIEALSWKTPNLDYLEKTDNFLRVSEILDLTPDIVAKTIELRRARRIKTPDAIIAATAMVHGLTLVSSDGGFCGIPHLKLLDPLAMG